MALSAYQKKIRIALPVLRRCRTKAALVGAEEAQADQCSKRCANTANPQAGLAGGLAEIFIRIYLPELSCTCMCAPHFCFPRHSRIRGGGREDYINGLSRRHLPFPFQFLGIDHLLHTNATYSSFVADFGKQLGINSQLKHTISGWNGHFEIVAVSSVRKRDHF